MTTAESQSQYTSRIENERLDMEKKMTDARTSPLSDMQISSFKGLDFFPVDMKYKVNARLSRAENERVTLNLTDGSGSDFDKFGTATFMLDGVDYAFDVFVGSKLPDFHDKDGQLFIPFSDGTSGRETSKSGRYIPVEATVGSDLIEVDFNRAINFFHDYNGNHVGITIPESNRPRHDFSVGQRKFEDR